MASNVTLEDVFEPLNDLDDPAAEEGVVGHEALGNELARSVETMESGS